MMFKLIHENVLLQATSYTVAKRFFRLSKIKSHLFVGLCDDGANF